MNTARAWLSRSVLMFWPYAIKWAVIVLLSLPIIVLTGCGGGGGSAPDPDNTGGGQSSQAAAINTLAISLNSLRTLIAANYVGRTAGVAIGNTATQTQPCDVSGTIEEQLSHRVLANCVNDIAPGVAMNGAGTTGAELTTHGGFVVTGSILSLDSRVTFISGRIGANSRLENAGYVSSATLTDANIRLGAGSEYDYEFLSASWVQQGVADAAVYADLAADGFVQYANIKYTVQTPTSLRWGTTNGGGPNAGSLRVVPTQEFSSPGFTYTFAADGAITFESTDDANGTFAWSEVQSELTDTAQ